jgi:hypothetical protein
MSNVFHIKIIGVDEDKDPVLLLPFFIIAFPRFLIASLSLKRKNRGKN